MTTQPARGGTRADLVSTKKTASAALISLGLVGLLASIWTLVALARSHWHVPNPTTPNTSIVTKRYRNVAYIVNAMAIALCAGALGLGIFFLIPSKGQARLRGLEFSDARASGGLSGAFIMATVAVLLGVALITMSALKKKQPEVALALVDGDAAKTFEIALLGRRSISSMWRNKSTDSFYVNSMFTSDEDHLRDTMKLYTMTDGSPPPPDLVNMVISGCQQNYWNQRTPWARYVFRNGSGWDVRELTPEDAARLDSLQCPTVANYWNGAISSTPPSSGATPLTAAAIVAECNGAECEA